MDAILLVKRVVVIYLTLQVLIIVQAASQWLLATFVEWDLPSLAISQSQLDVVPQRDALIQSQAVQLHVRVSGWRFLTCVTRRSGRVLLMVPTGGASDRSQRELRPPHGPRAGRALLSVERARDRGQ